ncbi:type I restriction endonuclease [Maridesulfovibrio ferrireducens]|uniref:type I restriction endonuclease n=1 Tax=Maridesulfovibrio ferrireducens TaxID=246191 RepID=UPI001A35715F|nr:type I restriction endonuclease [Maridesulfovibrio ferrireducens]MBI9110082.1 type I restriction enzyme HsdR N-terminal domain-containing protein [Maridesulfovibrio ferrireducens]
MDFADKVNALAIRVNELREHLATEEATKNALVQPFLQMLGYDTFDPRVVVPEFTSDTGTKKNEKVDYAVMKDGNPIMLMECKACGCTLDQGKANQLHRYFQNTPTARVAILTDGITYKFFSDLDKPNLMDAKPFMVFDFEKVEQALIPELRKISNGQFDENSTMYAAQNLKYTREIKRLLANQFEDPSDEFIRLFAGQVYSGPLRATVIEEFRDRVVQAAQDCINEIINDRLKSAMTGEAVPSSNHIADNKAQSENYDEDEAPKVVTTEEEIEGYHIIKSILREVVEPSRVIMRDTKSYCGVLLDDNNRKPLCRMHFNTGQKYLGLLDTDKNETRHPIESVDDIYSFADGLKESLARYND